MSLISTYQACKSLLAQHLTSKNKTANANEGLTTLIDKVADIQYFDDGIFLCGDKQITESGDTVNFTTLYLEDGKTVSGKKIIFDGLPSRYITTTPEDTSITMTGDYKIILPDSQDNLQWVSIGSTNKVIIFGYYLGRDSYYMEVDEFPVWITGNSVRVEGSSIYYLDEDGEDAVLDASDYDTTEVLAPFQVGGVILEDIFSDITDSYGVATVTYTGVGAGKLNVQAKTIDGRLQSEAYDVIDGIFTVISEETLANGARNYIPSSSDDGYDWDFDFCVEFDVKSVSYPSNQRFRIYSKSAQNINAFVSSLTDLGIADTEYHHLKFMVYEDHIIRQLDNGNPITTNKSFDTKCRVNFTKYGDNTPSTKIKNFVIYPL